MAKELRRDTGLGSAPALTLTLTLTSTLTLTLTLPKALFSGDGLTVESLEAAIKTCIASGNVGWGNGYGISKAALSAYTIVQARQHPALTIASISPGFIDTPMTQGFGARLTPEQGCVSALKCLFEPITSGFYYGSDGMRSPLTMTRDPGMPEYQGEEDPQQATYNKS